MHINLKAKIVHFHQTDLVCQYLLQIPATSGSYGMYLRLMCTTLARNFVTCNAYFKFKFTTTECNTNSSTRVACHLVHSFYFTRPWAITLRHIRLIDGLSSTLFTPHLLILKRVYNISLFGPTLRTNNCTGIEQYRHPRQHQTAV